MDSQQKENWVNIKMDLQQKENNWETMAHLDT